MPLLESGGVLPAWTVEQQREGWPVVDLVGPLWRRHLFPQAWRFLLLPLVAGQASALDTSPGGRCHETGPDEEAIFVHAHTLPVREPFKLLLDGLEGVVCESETNK